MRSTALAPAARASSSCSSSRMKSLRKVGNATCCATRARSSSEPPKCASSVSTDTATAPPPRVRPRVLHGIEVFSDRSRGRGAPFYLGDHPKGAALQRPVEGTRRWGGGRPTLELSGLRPERGDARPRSGQDLIQRGGGQDRKGVGE